MVYNKEWLLHGDYVIQPCKNSSVHDKFYKVVPYMNGVTCDGAKYIVIQYKGTRLTACTWVTSCFDAENELQAQVLANNIDRVFEVVTANRTYKSPKYIEPWRMALEPIFAQIRAPYNLLWIQRGEYTIKEPRKDAVSGVEFVIERKGAFADTLHIMYLPNTEIGCAYCVDSYSSNGYINAQLIFDSTQQYVSGGVVGVEHIDEKVYIKHCQKVIPPLLNQLQKQYAAYFSGNSIKYRKMRLGL